MPNLFPDSYYTDDTGSSTTNTNNGIEYKGSYKFDFNKGEFVKNPDGTVKKCDDLEAYSQWCQMALLTDRYKYIYSNLFGQEFSDLQDRQYSRDAIELEVKRMTVEALMVHPRTKDVINFTFTWQNNGELYYEYTVVTVDGNEVGLNNSVNVG
ncbi:DUF2634 domain-containing protein [Clostridium kluyveri]|uniref:Phage-related protein n=2 Tax=Clostridium kluyveri TaxID=1534 RepID=A5N2A7_CLOK5|nr:DUF2634 domain-containing protein [Clostridium kluyveri]EDK35253.1 Phage-related protein [Clostridium kluyveri DSM 555]BAH07927.1 hypothetical protein CKR_2876 [Clostridium kluyveri NBRC 12016]